VLVAAIDWTQVIVALIAGLPAIIAAYYARGVKRDIKTPSGRTLGEQVEGTLYTSIGNAHRLDSIRRVVGSDPPVNPEEGPYGPAPPPPPGG
jgi:hypothetical protein